MTRFQDVIMTEPLSVRMRLAANVLEEFNNRKHEDVGILYTSDAPWRPSELRREARHIEDEEQEATEHELMAQELVADFCAFPWKSHIDFARRLIANGWRKDI